MDTENGKQDSKFSGSLLKNPNDESLKERLLSEALYRSDGSSAGGSSFLRATLNGMNVLAGVGILSTPFGLKEGGWMALLLLCVFSVICLYTGLLLKKCMETDPGIRSYPDIGQTAFGQTGRFIVSSLLYMELYAVAIEFLIMEGDNLSRLFPGGPFGKKMSAEASFVVMSAVVIWPTMCLRELRVLAYVSAGGVISTVLLVVAVCWVALFDGVGFHNGGRVLRVSGMPTSIGLFAFCFCGHAVFPSICASMKRRDNFTWVLVTCFTIATILYGGMAVAGYMMFGDQLKSQVTLNLPRGSLASAVATYTVIIIPLAKYALTLNPLVNAMDHSFLLCEIPTGYRLLWQISLRTALLWSTVAVALTVPFFGYVMAFIGSSLSSSVSLILPSLCYLRLFTDRVTIQEKCALFCVVVLGVVTCIVGTYSSLRNIFRSF